jgi:hypothetical protein
MPKRIQMSRQHPWRDQNPEAMIVARPSMWGNPITFSDVGAQYPSLDDRQVAQLVVRTFEPLAKNGKLYLPNWRFLGGRRGPLDLTYPPVVLIRAALRGHDLACWCPLDMPCHADVLLELANPKEN